MKTTISLLSSLLLFVSISTLFATTVVDDFNRTTGLGPNWTFDPEYQIINNELANTRTIADWTSLAIYNAVSNPIEVSFRWSQTGDEEGVNSGGFAARLSSTSLSASGYHIMRRYQDVRLSAINNGVVQNTIQEVNATQPTPQPGDVIKIIISSDASGHHFDFYLNGIFDARVTDVNKTYGNGSTWYSGVCLFGDRNNNIDDFTIKYPSITVLSPNGGEDWTVNTSHTIQWTSDGFTGNVRIDYSTDSGGSWNPVSTSTANTGNYSWIVPNTPSMNCLVKVSDALDGQPWDISNSTFRISTAAQTITVTSPNGGENWIIGNENTVTWYATGGIINVKIEYSTNNGATWNPVNLITPNTGSYTWIPPAPPSDDCLVRISDASDGFPTDVSDTPFSLIYSVKLRVNNSSGQPGTQNNRVTIYMDNPLNVRGVQFTLTDVPNLLSATAVNTTARTVGFDPTFNETAVTVNLILYDLGGGLITPGIGNILELEYSIDGSAGSGDSTILSFSNVIVADENNENVFTELFNGVFHFSTPGDVSGPQGTPDGVVDWYDVDRLVQIVLGDIPTDYELLVADFDPIDGIIDLYDLLRTYDLIQ